MIKRDVLLMTALLLICCFPAHSAFAQEARQLQQPQKSSSESQEGSGDVSPDSADLAITANVTARELRFETVPKRLRTDDRDQRRISSLNVISETTNAAGQTLRRVRDTSGAVIELTLDAAGKVISSRVVSQATGTQR